ncbi:leucine-rich repeat domain-containing protein [Faecalimonas sp.]
MTNRFEEYKIEKKNDAVTICRCYVCGGVIEIPEEIDGYPVTEIENYAFSALGPAGKEDTSMCGGKLQEIVLPKTIKRIGKYAFYGCSQLQEISFYSNISDIGAGAFTGCHRVNKLNVTLIKGEKSCLRELLLELREKQLVVLQGEQGEAKLVFPEFFEEAVENTPARILETHTHGSGMWYRNCFIETQLQFDLYDKRFPWAKEDEELDTVLEMAFGRLLYPIALSQEAEIKYKEFLTEHFEEVCKWTLSRKDFGEIQYLVKEIATEKKMLQQMIHIAGEQEKEEIFSYLMNEKYERYPENKEKEDRFVL